MWFIYALITTVVWGIADLFYKRGADESDKYSHLKTSMIVGGIMGLHAIYLLVFGNINYDFTNILIYFPVSFMYILSMTIGYFGLRYLELSISSPIQNASGAVVCILCLLILEQTMDIMSSVAVALICLGVIALGILERAKIKKFEAENDRKYKIGLIAFMMPVLYCIIDSLGTFFDAYYLDDITTTPLRNVTLDTFENVANISYELTFLFCAVIIFIFLKFFKKEKLFSFKQKDRTFAAIFETIGQATYVFAMSGNGIVAAPMIASYCMVSVILSRIFIKEKLTKKQYAVVAVVIIGIILLGVAEGIAE